MKKKIPNLRKVLISIALAACLVFCLVGVALAANTYPSLKGTLSGDANIAMRNFDGTKASGTYSVKHIRVVVANQTDQFIWGTNYTLPGSTVSLWHAGQNLTGAAWYTVGAFGVVGNKTANNPRPYVTISGYNQTATTLVAVTLWGRVKLSSNGTVTRFTGKVLVQVLNTTTYLIGEGPVNLRFTP